MGVLEAFKSVSHEEPSVKSTVEKEPVQMFTLSTCGACRNTKALMRELNVPFDYIDVDLLSGREELEVLEEMRKYNPSESFPTLLIGKRVVVGFLEKDIRSAVEKL